MAAIVLTLAVALEDGAPEPTAAEGISDVTPMRSAATRLVLAGMASVIVTTAAVSPSQASDEWSFEAFQPIWTVNEICLSRVTVMTFNSGELGMWAAIATCDSSHVMTDYGPQQRNAAFEVGLRAEATFTEANAISGDTLHVILRSTKPPAGIDDHSYGKIVAATVKCILLNAAQSSAIKFVALRVDSDAPYRNYGGVFSMAGYRKGPPAGRGCEDFQ